MNKFQWISVILKVLGVLIALGLGVWYLSSAIGGGALTYTSTDNFLFAIGAKDGVEHVGTMFLGDYVVQLLNILGSASQLFWDSIVSNLWILMAAGFAIYLFISAIKYVWEKMKKNGEYSTSSNDIDFKTWFDPVWKLGLRIAIAGVAIGALSIRPSESLLAVSDILISPVLYIGSALSMAATNIGSVTECNVVFNSAQLQGAMAPVSGAFMCVLGNLYAIMLAGAAGGFALMNYAWMGLGGGMLTWGAGFALVLAFLIIGFDLFFQIFSILFKVVFVIIFLPILIAAAAYEQVWKIASGLFRKALGTVVSAAVAIISISLKITILFSIVYYAADSLFPGPAGDNYTSILPPMFEMQMTGKTTPQAQYVMNAFAKCEAESKDANGLVDADLFKPCFLEQKAQIEQVYPDAFDFLKDGWTFLLLMFGLIFAYYYVFVPRIDKLLPYGKVKIPLAHTEETDLSTSEKFDIGKWTYDLGAKAWRAPRKWFDAAVKSMKDKGIIS